MNKIKYILLLASMAVLLGACSEDFLEKESSDSISDETITKNAVTMDLALNGTYRRIAHPLFDGLHIPAIMEVKSGDAWITPANNYRRYVDQYKLNLTTTDANSSNIFFLGFDVIDNVNVLINGADQAQGDPAEIDAIVAEAKAIRAYIYLQLAHLYAEKFVSQDENAACVPLVVEPFKATDDLGAPRATNKQVYEQIIQDLLDAEGNLKANRTGRFTNRAVQALLARAYLDLGNWTEADKWAVACHGDQELQAEDITDGFYDYNDETIWGFDYTDTDNGGYLSHPSFWYFYDNRLFSSGEGLVYGYSSVRYTQEFVAGFDDNDIRKMFVIDISDQLFGSDVFGSAGSQITYKFRHRNDELSKARMIKMRVAEMYLIEAEAKAQLGNTTGAQDALFEVQSRSIPGAVKSTNSGQALLDEIYLERDKELYGEGFGVYDNIRLNIPVDRSSDDHWGYSASVIEGDDPILFLPIPQDEIDANPLLTDEDQNPHYK